MTESVISIMETGEAPERRRLTETNCILPANIRMLDRIAPSALNPLEVYTRPKPVPKVMYPAITGSVLRNACLSSAFGPFTFSFPVSINNY